VQPGEQRGQRVQRVRHPTAKRPGVQIPLRPGHIDLRVDHAPHRHAHRRHVGRPHAGVGYHHDVAGQPPGLGPQQVGEERRAGFLLALDEQLERDRRGAGASGGQAGPDAEGVEKHLALVVGGPAGQQLAVPFHGLERR
jgi:hypothetical protein